MPSLRSCRLPVWLIVGLSFCAASALAQHSPPTFSIAGRYPASSRYGKVIPRIERTFHGPIRLPKVLMEVGDGNDLYPQLLKVSASSYEVIFSATEEPCDGQHVCSWGSVTASDHLEASDTLPLQVQLADGLEGQFHKAICGTYCGEATLDWREGKFYYAIGIKAGTREDLVEAANSAIALGHVK